MRIHWCNWKCDGIQVFALHFFALFARSDVPIHVHILQPYTLAVLLMCKIFEWFFFFCIAYPYFHAAHEFPLHQKDVSVPRMKLFFLEACSKFVVPKQSNHRIFSLLIFFSLPTFWFHPTHKIHFTFIAVFLQSRLNCWILNLALPFNFFQLAPAHTHFSLLLRNIYMKFAPPAAEISRLFLCTKKKKQTIYDTKKCMVRVFHQLKRFPCSIWICSFDSLFEWVWEIISLMNVLFALPIPTEIWPIVVQKKNDEEKIPPIE